MKNGRYQIVTTTWHVMHFWDLFNALKDDADFFLIHNTHRNWAAKTFLAARPVPANASFVPTYEPGKYDLAILDVDQQCVNMALGKSKLPRELKKLITDIPRIFINHATPVYPEHLCKEGMDKPAAEAECRRLIQQIVGDDTMVVNSHTAASGAEWGWGFPIWHGMEPAEWLDLPKEPRVFTALSPAGCDEYYNRDVMVRVSELLKDRYGHTLWWAKNNIKTEESLDDYKTFLGRSLIYLDASFRTPMNRARTEAMLSGCCVVQVEGAHDLDQPVSSGKLGDYMVLVPNKPEVIAERVADMIEHEYDKCLEIGKRGKEMAMQTFTRERYRQGWLTIIRSVLKS
jgi:hypothetical protein